MNKQELIKELAVSERLHLSTAVKAVDGISRIIMEALAKGETIFVRGLGTFKVIHREAKIGRDFRSGEAVNIPAKNIVKFIASKDLAQNINCNE